MPTNYEYRCKFLVPLPFNASAEEWKEWQENPPDGGLPLCPVAYRLCHSPCDLLQPRAGNLIDEVEGAPV